MIINLISLLDLDQSIFYLINDGMSNKLFDSILPILREKLFWIPLYLFLIAFVAINFKWKVSLIFISSLVLTIGMTDFTSSKLIKNGVERLRPCNDPNLKETMTLRVICGNGYSFTSSHAANHFAFALFLIYTIGRLFKKFRWPLIIWASMISFAQVYVGVHYPFDVIFGALLGTIIGMLSALIYNKYVTESIYSE